MFSSYLMTSDFDLSKSMSINYTEKVEYSYCDVTQEIDLEGSAASFVDLSQLVDLKKCSIKFAKNLENIKLPNRIEVLDVVGCSSLKCLNLTELKNLQKLTLRHN